MLRISIAALTISLLSTSLSAQSIFGTPFNDNLFGGLGDQDIWGFDGHDQLNGGDGDDILLGGEGNDSLWGGDGEDLLFDPDGYNDFHSNDFDADIIVCDGGQFDTIECDLNDSVYCDPNDSVCVWAFNEPQGWHRIFCGDGDDYYEWLDQRRDQDQSQDG